MKIIRYLDSNQEIRFGVINKDGSAYLAEGDLFNLTPTETPALISETLHPIEAVDIFCIGLNYEDHAKETGSRTPDYPILFMKSTNALQKPEGNIVLPYCSDKIDYEAELAVIIGKDCKNATEENALDYVFGYSCANDVSSRDWQIEKGGSQWCRAKSFDGFCPLGPHIVTKDEITDPNNLNIQSRINGETMQNSNTNKMIFNVKELIAFLSQSTTLRQGTVILTGTPHGVGMSRKPPRWLKDGDIVEIEIEGIGVLRSYISQ